MENPKCDLGLGTWATKIWARNNNSRVSFFIVLIQVRIKDRKSMLKT
jgi:hypothetical protein